MHMFSIATSLESLNIKKTGSKGKYNFKTFNQSKFNYCYKVIIKCSQNIILNIQLNLTGTHLKK